MASPAAAPSVAYRNNQTSLVASVMVMLGLAAASAALRFLMRYRRRAGFRLDDWLILASIAPMVGLAVCATLGITQGGIGRPFQVNLAAMQENSYMLTRVSKLLYAVHPPLLMNIALIKFSILAMYYRLFHTQYMKWTCAIVGTFTGLWFVGSLLATLFQCTPIPKAWVPTLEGRCFDTLVFYITSAGFLNLFIDVSIWCLPTYEVYKLKLPAAQRIAIAGTFLIGFVVLIADVFKLHAWMQLLYEVRSGSKVPPIWSGHMTDIVIWTIVEHALSIVCANIPAMRPILTGFLRWAGMLFCCHRRGRGDKIESSVNSNNQPLKPHGREVATIGGGSGGSEGRSGKKGGKKARTGWTTLLQETVDEEAKRAKAPTGPMTTPQQPLRGGGEALEADEKIAASEAETEVSAWQVQPGYRVTINSAQQPRTGVPSPPPNTRRTGSLRRSSANPQYTACGPGTPRSSSIAVTTNTQVAWDPEKNGADRV